METAWALIGRDRELAELTTALDAGASGRGTLLLIGGEPGIGKTRLADAFSTLAAQRRAFVAWGRAWEVGGAPAYWPWIEVFRELLRASGAAVDLPGARLGELAQIDPELRARLPELPAPPPLDPAQARFRLFDAASALLRYFARDRTLVIVLDDVHAADAASLDLLHFAARGLRGAPIVFVATYRDAEARCTPEIADALARVAREGRTLQLTRLGHDDVTRWLAADADLGELVFQRSEGNPLLVVELIRLVREHGAGALAAVPDGVRAVMRERLRTIAPPRRGPLEAAAAIGRYVALPLLARVLGISVEQVEHELGPAVTAGILVPAGSKRLAFSHVLLQEVVYGEISVERRAALHSAVADALAAAGAPLAEVVHHLFAAAPARGIDDAIDWSRRAARRAIDQLAFDDAVSLLERAVAALPPGRTTERIDLQLELSRALLGAGRASAGRQICLEVVAEVRRLGDAERLARAALTFGELRNWAHVQAELGELLEEALAALPPGDGALRAQLLGRLAAALQPGRDYVRPMQLAREAIAMSRRTAELPLHLDVLYSGTSALAYFADPAERRPLDHELTTVATRLGDKARALRGNLRLVCDYLEQNDPHQADACIAACASLAEQIDRPAFSWPIPLLRAMRCVMKGQFAEAEAHAEEARTIAAQSEQGDQRTTLALHRVGLLRASARHDELAAFIPTLVNVLGRFDVYFAESCIAAAHARAGDLLATRGVIDQLRGRLSEHHGRLGAVFLAEAAAALDDAALAREVYPLLLPIAARTHAWGVMTMVCEAPVSRALGLAAATAGAHDDAERHFEDALRGIDALGAPPQRMRIEVEYAAMLNRRDRAGDRERAARLLDGAAAVAQRLGMSPLAAPPGPPPVASTPAPQVANAPRFELRSEGDYWTVTCDGFVFRLKDSRGMRILALLIASPAREFHATDLFAPAGQGGHVEDAGDMLDARAIASYRERIRDLQEQLAEAEDWADQGRAARMRDELEALTGELARGLGLGGRARRASSSSERARVNVRKRVHDAIARIAEHSEVLARHLESGVKTGTFCAYYPGGAPRRGDSSVR